MKKLFLFSAILGAVSLGSCKKGCNDADAINYDSSVKKDDGSCSYESNLIMWWGEDVATFFVSDGAGNIEVFVDNVKIDVVAPTVYWTGVSCETTNAIDINLDLGGNKNRFVNVKLIDDTGWTYYDVTLEVYPGCTTHEFK